MGLHIVGHNWSDLAAAAAAADTSCEWNHEVRVFCDWLIAPCMVSLWLTHVAYGRIPVFFKAELHV